MQDGKTALQLTKSRAVRDAINGVIEAKAEAEKQLAITERSARLTTLLLASDLSGVRELISGNTFVEVYNVSSPRKECPFSRPIEIAVYMRLPEAVAALLEAGADPDVTHPQVTLAILQCDVLFSNSHDYCEMIDAN